MPIASAYNNPTIGAAMSNIASLFAPPSAGETIAAQQLALNKQQADARADAIAKLQADFPGATGLASLFVAGDSDPVGHTADLLRTRTALQNPENPAALDALVYAKNGDAGNTFAGKAMAPLGIDTVRYNPLSVQAMGLPSAQYGVLKNGDQTTILPNGRLPSLAPAASDDDSAAPAGGTAAGAAPAAPDGGLTAGPGGVVTISGPNKPDKMPSMEQLAAAWAAQQPKDVQNKIFAQRAQGSGTNISVNTAGDDQTYADGAMKVLGASHYALADGVSAAQAQLRDINLMKGALQRIQQNGGTTGIGTDEKVKLQSALNTGASVLGLPEPFDVDDPQIMTKVNRTLAGAQAKGVAGARVTNFEMNNFLQSNPGLALSPNANQTLLGIQGQIAQRNVDLGNAVRGYYAQAFQSKQPPQPARVEQMILDYDNAHHIVDPVSGQDLTQNPVLASGAAPSANGPVKVASPADAAKLPTGTQIQLPDGRIGMVP